MSLKININENYNNVKKSYLFSEIANRVGAYTESHPNADIVRLKHSEDMLPNTVMIF